MRNKVAFKHNDGLVRYAVVGAGHIAQNAILPAFSNARRNSVLTAIVSGDPVKRAGLGRLYNVPLTVGYDEYDDVCRSGAFDAVYIALPNSLHCEYAMRAAAAGIHVLCEKPMAVTSMECKQMIQTARQHHVKFMVAYRLHFEEANLRAIEIARSGQLGDLKYFSSSFSMQVRPDNIRVKRSLGGGPLQDLGIYCINAARYLFHDDPLETCAFGMGGFDARFNEIDASVSVLLRFPANRIAVFTCSFDAADVSRYQLVGGRGTLTVDPAYEYEGELRHILTINGKPHEKTFTARDQFAAELLYFSDCVIRNHEIEPGAIEGLIDVRIMEAIHRSIETGRAIQIPVFPIEAKPQIFQENQLRPSRKKPLIRAESGHL